METSKVFNFSSCISHWNMALTSDCERSAGARWNVLHIDKRKFRMCGITCLISWRTLVATFAIEAFSTTYFLNMRHLCEVVKCRIIRLAMNLTLGLWEIAVTVTSFALDCWRTDFFVLEFGELSSWCSFLKWVIAPSCTRELFQVANAFKAWSSRSQIGWKGHNAQILYYSFLSQFVRLETRFGKERHAFALLSAFPTLFWRLNTRLFF